MSESGYSPCACRDCFDVAVSNDIANPDLCGLCADAGCDEEGESACERDHDLVVIEVPGVQAPVLGCKAQLRPPGDLAGGFR